MTDVLDRSAAGDAASGPEPTASTPSASRPETSPAHWMVAAALVGAAAIHFAMAPSHIDESAVEGAGFLGAAWAQSVLAAAALRRPSRRVMLAIVGLDIALIGTWVISRTAGLPFGDHAGHAETVALVDGVCVALEAAAGLLAAGLLIGVALRARGLALAGVAAAVVVTTGAVASPSARDHAASSHGEHAAAGGGHDHGDMAEDDLGFASLSNGHQHEVAEQPLTDEERVTLAQQLAATSALVEQYPTLGAATAAGWRRAGPFVPGLGTHYSSRDRFVMNADGDMDPEDLQAPTLIYDGLEPDAPLAGFMYMAYGTETVPEGFAGPNDHWHYHKALCLVYGPDGNIDTPFGADLEDVTEKDCSDVGGSWVDMTGYMVHVWNVPGYESPDGMFHEVNRKITCPDGTYYRIPTKEIGRKDSVCRNP